MKRWRRFWRDERGEVGLLGVVLLYAILALGVIVGLTVLRNAIVQEFGDLATALKHVDQSYSFVVGGTTHQYIDTETTSLDAPAGQPPAGIIFTEPSGAAQ
jgi:Flp pilus assembly pilin Flp